MRRKTTLRTLATVGVLAVLSAPHATSSQTCANAAARNLLGGDLADSVLNPASMEDMGFLSSQAGFPNIFFLVDTSGSMLRLPPNGPPYQAWNVTLPSNGYAGCDTTAEFGGIDLTVFNQMVARRYHSPCGTTPWENLPYQGDPAYVVTGVNYASAGALCGHYTPSNNQQTGDPGYDPDFFATGTGTTVGGGAANLFPRDLIFHETMCSYKHWGITNNPWAWPAYGPDGDGWYFNDSTGMPEIYPWQSSAGVNGTIASFCSAQGTALQNGRTKRAICTSCLAKRGWYYDGSNPSIWVPEAGDYTPTPNIWYTGNYLNFFPPKFVVARKVVKDVIATQSRIRMALAQFTNANWDEPPGIKVVRDFNPSCTSIFGSGNWEQNRTTYVNDVNAMPWGGATPLATSLFQIGQYFHSTGLSWFGLSGWPATSLPNSLSSANQAAICWSCQNSSVIVLTDGAPSGQYTSWPSNTYYPADGNGLPGGSSSIASSNTGIYAGNTGTGILSPSAADCPECYAFTDGWNNYYNNLTRVAFYLQNYDLRNDAAGTGSNGTLDCQGMAGKQVIDTYTVGFGTSQFANANTILQNAAKVGGGLFFSADAADELKQGIFKVFQVISERSTSFSVATVSTLQTTTGHAVIVPRFDPSRDAIWPGHLYRYELYSEFVNNCIPGGTGDFDCDGSCQSVFLQDKDGDFIAEDGNGHFVKTNAYPSCDVAPLCQASGRCTSLASANVPAAPWWDAAPVASNVSWKDRSIWTVIDDHAPTGTFDGSDTMVQLAWDNTTADLLKPYLGLGTNGGVCADIAARIQTAGDSITAQIVASDKRECAKTIIRYVLGADVFNEVGRTAAGGWPPPPSSGGAASASNPPNQDALLDRKFKLGDVFHSSPVVVDPPPPADGFVCPSGLHNQCLQSLWMTPVKSVNQNAYPNPYNAYAHSTTYGDRRKIILVGANDGMLHAFAAGDWHANDRDGVAWNHGQGIDTSLPPFNGYYDRGEQNGGPRELWGFVPPDLLGKLYMMMTSGTHQLYVDGTAMVRDVWVDGAPNSLPASYAVDDLKSPAEFHTVAVVGERRGGNHFFALDVTDATADATKPKFLWVYPQPSDGDSLKSGETYTDFLPVPPPIGPVRIKADSYSGSPMPNTPTFSVPGVATPVPYHERWVVLLPGGFDPQYLRGRGVHMLDVWTGQEYLDFSYDPTAATGSPKRGLTFPIAATPGMVMWGKGARREQPVGNNLVNGGYFDTATFGDTGGQLWVLRFNTPGTLDATGTGGKVTNWFGGRIFQMGATSCNGSLCNRMDGQPFFYLTANTVMPNTYYYRVFAGTGDRFNILDTNGGTCGPDNIRACAQRGCTVTLDAGRNVTALTDVGGEGRGFTQAACTSSAQASFNPSVVTTAAPACGTRTTAGITVTCGSGGTATGFTKDVALTCGMDAAGDYGCTAGTSASATGFPNQGANVDLTPSWTANPQSRNWYFALRAFDESGDRIVFTTSDEADAYDAARYYLQDNVTSPDPLAATVTHNITDLAVIDGSLDNPTTLSDEAKPGWALYYNHGPSVTVDSHTYTVNRLDERTGSVNALWGALTWNALQAPLSEGTTSATGSCKQSKCTASFRRISYHYGADPVTGGVVLSTTSGLRRSIASNTQVLAQGDQPTVFVNQQGQISVGLTAVNPEKGASNVGGTAAMDTVMGLGAIETPRDLHGCRHFLSSSGTAAALSPAERATVNANCK